VQRLKENSAAREFPFAFLSDKKTGTRPAFLFAWIETLTGQSEVEVGAES
jgi:hypothetical protein